MTSPAPRLRRHPPGLLARWVGAWLLACATWWAPGAIAAQLERDAFYWYVPEHEKYIRTEFHSEPDFRSALVRITRTQRFRFVDGRRGWAVLEFDGGLQAYIHLRILRTLQWNPTADDPWYEFQRASVFPEEPQRIEARLKRGLPEPPRPDTRTPVWQRYKDSWGLDHTRKGREGEGRRKGVTGATENRYPLLPPILPVPEAADSAEGTGASGR